MIICSASSYYLPIISNCDLQQQYNMIMFNQSCEISQTQAFLGRFTQLIFDLHVKTRLI